MKKNSDHTEQIEIQIKMYVNFLEREKRRVDQKRPCQPSAMIPGI